MDRRRYPPYRVKRNSGNEARPKSLTNDRECEKLTSHGIGCRMRASAVTEARIFFGRSVTGGPAKRRPERTVTPSIRKSFASTGAGAKTRSKAKIRLPQRKRIGECQLALKRVIPCKTQT